MHILDSKVHGYVLPLSLLQTARFYGYLFVRFLSRPTEKSKLNLARTVLLEWCGQESGSGTVSTAWEG